MKLKTDKKGHILMASLPRSTKTLEHFLVTDVGQEYLNLVGKFDPAPISTWEAPEAPVAINPALVMAYAASVGPAYHLNMMKLVWETMERSRGIAAAELAQTQVAILKVAERMGLLDDVQTQLEGEGHGN